MDCIKASLYVVSFEANNSMHFLALRSTKMQRKFLYVRYREKMVECVHMRVCVVIKECVSVCVCGGGDIARNPVERVWRKYA